MHVPRATTATERIVDNYGVYLSARLKAEPAARRLVPEYAKADRALREVRARERAAHTAVKEAEAARDFADDEARTALVVVEVAVRSLVNGNRKAPVYHAYFPRGLTPLSEGSPEQRVEYMAVVERMLSREPRDSAPAGEHRRFAKAHADLARAMRELTAARTAHEMARRREVEARVRWQAAYRKIHASLTLLFPSNPRKVESFFHAGPKKRRGEREA